MQGRADNDNSGELQCLLGQILVLWLHGREHRIAIGRLLISVHGHGYGSFLQTVTEPPPAGLGISYKTACDYMAVAREAYGTPCGATTRN
jgi:hypothetical protein